MTISYGHGMTTSPLALAAGYAALVNGGRMVTPTLLRQDSVPDGPQVISPETSAQERESLQCAGVYERQREQCISRRDSGVSRKVRRTSDREKRTGEGWLIKKNAVLADIRACVFPSDNQKYVYGP